MIERLSRGVLLEDGGAKFDEIERIGGTDSHDWFRVVVKEGRNREVRRLWESQGCQVSRLKRTRYGKVSLPRELLRGQSVELAQEKVDALRAELKLEEGAPSALTLQPVIGQRRAAKSTVHVSRDGRSNAYVNGQTSGADEGRELRRFDNLREDRGGRGGRGKPGGFKGGLTVSGEAAAKQSQQRPFKQRGPAKGDRSLPDGNPAAFRSWYVPDGVSTGPSGHRNAGPGGAGTGQPRPYAKKGPGGARPGAGGQAAARQVGKVSRRVKVRASASTPTATRATRRASRPITPTRVSARMAPHVRQLVARPVRVQAAPAATVDQAVIVVPVVRAAHRVAQVVRVVVPGWRQPSATRWRQSRSLSYKTCNKKTALRRAVFRYRLDHVCVNHAIH